VGRKYFIETFGCQMNVHDSERIAGLLEQDGYEAVPDESSADLVVINTCSVREKAEEKLYARLGDLKSAAPSTTIAVTGCVAQQE
jgi:tRNA-2-methylthio-N6-dimethylallyladenosine synthase